MAPFALDLEKTKIKSSLVRLEPALNAFGSMLLVAKAEDEPGFHEWVTRTRSQMSSEERFRHKLVFIGFHYAITGGVQFARDKVQVNLQLIDCASYKQVWSATIEKQVSKSNFFDVQDEICLYAMKRLEHVGESHSKKTERALIVNADV